MYEFINTLSESRLIPSLSAYRQYDADDLADIAVLYFCTLNILFHNKATHKVAVAYAKRTLQFGIDFHEWHTGGTDLYTILYALLGGHVQFSHQDQSERFREHLPIDTNLMVRWLRDMGQGVVRPATHRQFFTRMDFQFRTSNQSIRAVRRLVMDWGDLSMQDYRLSTTRLIQLLKNKAPRCELLGHLRDVADHHDLEIAGACDKDSGIGCATGSTTSYGSAEKPKANAFLRGLAGVGVGLVASHLLHRKK